MIAVAFLMLFFTDNADFFEMVDEQTKQGYTWHYVGKTEVTPELTALPIIDEHTGKEYYYYKLKK